MIRTDDFNKPADDSVASIELLETCVAPLACIVSVFERVASATITGDRTATPRLLAGCVRREESKCSKVSSDGSKKLRQLHASHLQYIGKISVSLGNHITNQLISNK